MDDRLHRPQHQDTHTGPDCQFCRLSDPEFGKRSPLDKMVCSALNDTASAHITENGYVRHRMLEIQIRIAATKSGLVFGPITNVA
jgi:hypothetical protein